MPLKWSIKATAGRISARYSPSPRCSCSYTGASSQRRAPSSLRAGTSGQGLGGTDSVSAVTTAKRSPPGSGRHSWTTAWLPRRAITSEPTTTSSPWAWCSAAAMRWRSDPAKASMRWVRGSPTEKRRACPAATATRIAGDSDSPWGIETASTWLMASCIARAQAVARRPSSPSNQQVMLSPAKLITLPP